MGQQCCRNFGWKVYPSVIDSAPNLCMIGFSRRGRWASHRFQATQHGKSIMPGTEQERYRITVNGIEHEIDFERIARRLRLEQQLREVLADYPADDQSEVLLNLQTGMVLDGQGYGFDQLIDALTDARDAWARLPRSFLDRFTPSPRPPLPLLSSPALAASASVPAGSELQPVRLSRSGS